MDYQNMFNFEEFRPILQKFFDDREINRILMDSSVNRETKKLYFKRIHVFEEAFYSRVFEKIN